MRKPALYIIPHFADFNHYYPYPDMHHLYMLSSRKSFNFYNKS